MLRSSDKTLVHVGGRNTKLSVNQRLEIGSHVDQFLAARTDLGKRKWRDVAECCFKLRYTAAVATRLSRCCNE